VKRNVLAGAPANGKEIAGFQAYIDTTEFAISNEFQHVDVVANSEFQGNVIDALGAPINHDLLLRSLNRGRVVGDAEPTDLISNFVQARVFLGSELQKTRYEPENVKAGNTKLTWNTLKWEMDKDCDPQQVFMPDLSDPYLLGRYQVGEPKLAEYDGKPWLRTTGKNEISAYYIWYGNMGGFERNKHIKIKNLGLPSIGGVDQLF
jgi:hypothetical protein